FLGAGLILQDKGKVRGLTTAASLWAISAVGVAVALNLALLATLTTVILVLMLRVQQTSLWYSVSPSRRLKRQQELDAKREKERAEQEAQKPRADPDRTSDKAG